MEVTRFVWVTIPCVSTQLLSGFRPLLLMKPFFPFGSPFFPFSIISTHFVFSIFPPFWVPLSTEPTKEGSRFCFPHGRWASQVRVMDTPGTEAHFGGSTLERWHVPFRHFEPGLSLRFFKRLITTSGFFELHHLDQLKARSPQCPFSPPFWVGRVPLLK